MIIGSSLQRSHLDVSMKTTEKAPVVPVFDEILPSLKFGFVQLLVLFNIEGRRF